MAPAPTPTLPRIVPSKLVIVTPPNNKSPKVKYAELLNKRVQFWLKKYPNFTLVGTVTRVDEFKNIVISRTLVIDLDEGQSLGTIGTVEIKGPDVKYIAFI